MTRAFVLLSLFALSCAHRGATPATFSRVSFIAVGDTGAQNPNQNQVTQAMTRFCAKQHCDFVVMLGDNFYPSGIDSVTDPRWKTIFEEPFKDLSIPFYVTLGNHDYGDDGSGKDVARAETQVQYTAHSTKWKMPANRYHVPLGTVDLFATDTNIAYWGDDTAMRDDLKRWLAASKAPWKIAFGHHPYFSNGPHRDAGNNEAVAGRGVKLKSFFEDVVCGKADVYLAGHDHSLQWLTPTCQGTELFVSGSGQSFSSVKDFHPAHFQKSGLGFIYFEADAQTLTASFVDENGDVMFSRSINK